MFKAVNQCLNGTIANRGKGKLITLRDGKQLATLNYSVIMCNSFDNIFAARMDYDEVPPHAINENSSFMMEIDYAYPSGGGVSRDEYFLVDVVDIRKVDQYFAAIKIDADLAWFFTQFNN